MPFRFLSKDWEGTELGVRKLGKNNPRKGISSSPKAILKDIL